MARSTLPSFLSIICFLALVILRAQAYTFLGCVSTTATVTATSPSEPDEQACAGFCEQNGNTPYFYYQTGGGLCECGPNTPSADYWVQSASDTGGCQDTSLVVLYSTVTSFQFQKCYSNMVTDNAPPDQSTLEGCFEACRYEGSVMVEPLAGRNAFGCRCNNAYTIQGTDGNGVGACDSYTWFTYVHSQEAAATGWSKRQQKARLAEKRRREQALCPSHLTACTIPQTASYECIDTGSELESCGGCMHGEHGRLNSTAGMDCSTLPGVAFGAVTCYDSRCEAFACKAGYRLVGDFCVPV